jgi:hypothetical protein
MPAFEIPSQISDRSSIQSPNYIHFVALKKVPATVLYLRVKSDKKLEKPLNKARKELKDIVDIDSGNFWFRGLDLRSLALSMTFFIPVINTSNSDNEFGPGIYAADDFLSRDF